MTFLDCVRNTNLLTPKQLEQLENKYNQLVDRYTDSMGSAVAANEAAARIIKVEAEQLRIRKRNTLLQVQKNIEFRSKFNEKMATSDRSKVKIPFGKDRLKSDAEMAYDIIYEEFEGARLRQQSVFKQLTNNLLEYTDEFKTTMGGFLAKKEGQDLIVRELLGESTGNGDASRMAKQIRDSLNLAHERYKAAGGSIGYIENWVPQKHNREKIGNVSFDKWYEFLRPKLDMERMIDLETGMPFTEERLLEVMRGVYDDIKTNGRASLVKKLEEGGTLAGLQSREVSVRREQSRFIHFKNADDWLEYNREFGEGDAGIFDMIMGHFGRMSKDISMMETLGPKPNAFRRFTQDIEEIHNIPNRSRKFLDGVYNVLSDRLGGDDKESGIAFNALANTQNIMRSAYLGGASISALSDATFISATSKINGMSSTGVLKKYMGLMNPANDADRRLAKRMGYIAEQTSGQTLQDSRFTMDLLGNKLTRKLAEFTNRASGLEAITTAGKNAITMEYLGTLADLVTDKKLWNDINPDFKNLLQKFGINENDWDIMKKAQLLEDPEASVKFYDIDNILEIKDVDKAELLKIASKVEDVNFYLRDIATNEANLTTRAITTGAFTGGDASKGTWTRAIASSVFMFKSFPITVLMNHIYPMIKNVTYGKRLDYAAQIALGTTILGGLSLQTKEVTKGRTPRDMDDWKFWQAAALQGGGLGLFGDFFFAEYSRFGRDPFTEFTGPIPGLLSDIGRTFKGNLERSADGKDSRFLKDMFNLARRNTPGLNLWYSRLVLDRLLLDNIEQAVDPKFHKNLRRMERRWQRETGQKYWWRKGEMTPRGF